jgi:DNA-binding transcriptional LysR family regulator
VFARVDHRLAHSRQISFERIAAEPFLMREHGSGMRLLATQLFDRHGLTPRISLELNDDDAIKEAILAGMGVAIMSRFTFGLEPGPSRLICLDVDGFPLENHWHFAYPVGKQLSATARAFMDFARVEAKGLVTPGPGQAEQQAASPRQSRASAKARYEARRVCPQAALGVAPI